jgi:hypothetical protein
MNCGASLIAYGRKQEDKRRYSVLSPSRILTKKKPVFTPAKGDVKPWDDFDISTDDNFVKPSEIIRDRIRSVSVRRSAESELEKAKHAFAKADSVGIDESGTGVIETRMLRASEVQELLSDWGPSHPEETESSIVESESMVLPDLQASEPTREEMEQHFLGSHSTLTKLEYSERQQTDTVTSRIVRTSDDFSSTLYEKDQFKPETEPTEEVQWELESEEKQSKPELPSESIEISTESIPWVITCPDCGKVMHSDFYEYPNEVYNHMGNSRLKQAKLFFIEGNPEEALKAARLARLFFEKTKDERGLIELARLERLLGPTR